MSNYNLKAKNKKTGEIENFIVIDNYGDIKECLYHVQHWNEGNFEAEIITQKEFNELWEVIEDEKCSSSVVDSVVAPETLHDRFNQEFVDEDTGLLNIGKYDHERLLDFINKEIKNNE